jgi:hypothetical protein
MLALVEHLPEVAFPERAEAHQRVAHLEGVTVGRDPRRAGFGEPQRRLLPVRVGTGEVVVARAHREAGRRLHQGEVLQHRDALRFQWDSRPDRQGVPGEDDQVEVGADPNHPVELRQGVVEI